MPEAGTSTWDAAFAADLHLQAADRAGLDRAVRLIELCRDRTRHLYLLGDVFDLWTSAGMLRLSEMQPVYQALREASDAGLEVVFLPGNRDFNLTSADGELLGLRVEGEVVEETCAGTGLYLTHGDRFLWNDLSYQRYKRLIRSAPLRFLARHVPDFVSLWLARRLRRYSDEAVAAKSTARLAIVREAVAPCFKGGARYALCGHVHRAERVPFGEEHELLVLPPFLEDPRFLVLTDGLVQLADLEGSLTEFAPPPGPTRTQPEGPRASSRDPSGPDSIASTG